MSNLISAGAFGGYPTSRRTCGIERAQGSVPMASGRYCRFCPKAFSLSRDRSPSRRIIALLTRRDTGAGAKSRFARSTSATTRCAMRSTRNPRQEGVAGRLPRPASAGRRARRRWPASASTCSASRATHGVGRQEPEPGERRVLTVARRRRTRSCWPASSGGTVTARVSPPPKSRVSVTQDQRSRLRRPVAASGAT